MPPASASMCSSSTSEYLALCVCGHDLVPQHARLHDVALFHRADPVVAGARQLEGDAGDALDLVGVVDLRVDAALLAVAEVDDLLRLAEIDAAGQLAHDQDVEALDQLAASARRRRRAPDSRSPGADWRTARGPCAGAAGRPRGAPRRARSSHFGPPTAPNSTASAASAFCHVGFRDRRAMGVIGASRRRGPRRWRSRRPASAFIQAMILRTSAMTSGPMPSPGRRRSLCEAMVRFPEDAVDRGLASLSGAPRASRNRALALSLKDGDVYISVILIHIGAACARISTSMTSFWPQR